MADFRLVQRDGIDTLHRSPAHESCNTDDASDPTTLEISEEEAILLLQGGTVDACHHCEPLFAPGQHELH